MSAPRCHTLNEIAAMHDELDRRYDLIARLREALGRYGVCPDSEVAATDCPVCKIRQEAGALLRQGPAGTTSGRAGQATDPDYRSTATGVKPDRTAALGDGPGMSAVEADGTERVRDR